MKNPHILITIFLLIVFKSYSQDLYVSPSSYVFVQDEVLFVNNDIQLDDTDSNIFLREGAQLLQKSDMKNSDAGEISVYQEQTQGIYAHNAWVSPVGITTEGSSGNTLFNITNLHKPNNPNLSSDTSSSVYGTTNSYNSTAELIAKYWIFTFISGESYNDWIQVSDFRDIESGYGFSLKGSPTNNNTIDFRGRANTGTLNLECKSDSPTIQVSTLTGNPYPSSIDLKKFLMHPINKVSLDGSILFWEQKDTGSHYLKNYEGGYATYVPGAEADYNDPNDINWADNGNYSVATFTNYDSNGEPSFSTGESSTDFSTNNSRRYAAIGQGFMVYNNPLAGGDFVIENDMRVYIKEDSDPNGNGSVFGKGTTTSNEVEVRAMSHNGIDYQTIVNSSTKIPEIRIHTHINSTYFRENVIAFRENSENTYNKFTDGVNYDILNSDTFLIAEDNKLNIKSINYNEDAYVPFGFNANNETNNFSVKVNRINNFEDKIEVFIYDNELDTYTDIVNNSLDITLPKGDYNDRFEIVFKNSKQVLADNNIIKSSQTLDAYQNNNNKLFVINNPNAIQVKSLSIFDITGKVIFSKNNIGNVSQYTYPTNSLETGTYIIKIETENNINLNKKIIINN